MWTFAVSTSYSFFIASLMFRLFALRSTMNTSVLWSSIFFMADSVLSGCWIVRNWSMRGMCGTDFRGYRGFRGRRSVLGRWKETEVRTLRRVWDEVPLRTAFFAALAFASWGLAATESKEDQLMTGVSDPAGKAVE